MNRIPFIILIFACVSACAPAASKPVPDIPSSQSTLTVFAAASLTESFGEITMAFETAHPGVDVSLNFAGSNTLRAQIEQGAQADVFASANTKEMETLIANGLVEAGAPKIFLTNRLVIIAPRTNQAGVSTLGDLANNGLKLVLAAEEVPVGRYARQMLDKAGADFKSLVIANVVSNETDVKQVVAKVQLGEADAGIVYASDAVAAQELQVIEILAELNVLAEYPLAMLKNAPQPELAAEFVTFVLSPERRSILQKWGFSTP